MSVCVCLKHNAMTGFREGFACMNAIVESSINEARSCLLAPVPPQNIELTDSSSWFCFREFHVVLRLHVHGASCIWTSFIWQLHRDGSASLAAFRMVAICMQSACNPHPECLLAFMPTLNLESNECFDNTACKSVRKACASACQIQHCQLTVTATSDYSATAIARSTV